MERIKVSELFELGEKTYSKPSDKGETFSTKEKIESEGGIKTLPKTDPVKAKPVPEETFPPTLKNHGMREMLAAAAVCPTITTTNPEIFGKMPREVPKAGKENPPTGK